MPDIAKHPINAVSFCCDDSEIELYLLNIDNEIDSKVLEIKKNYSNVTMFNDETTLLKAFFARIHKYAPDIIAGWNINHFDLPYIATRMKKLGISNSLLSPFSNFYADYKRGRPIMTGYIILDQLQLFKDLTYTNYPSYKLDSIAEAVCGEHKEKYDGDLNSIYNNDIETFIKYSIKDTYLLRAIESNVNHISLQDELRKASTTTHGSAASTIGQAEGLFLTSMKSKNMSARNGSHPEKETLPGAYVFKAKGGLYPRIGEKGMLCDFDFTSLYPSIINTWNIGPNTLLGKIDPDDMFNYLYDKDKLKDKKISFKHDPIHYDKLMNITVDELDKIVKDNEATLNITGCIYKGHNIEESIYFSVIADLFANRKKNKSLMFDYKQAGDKENTVIYNNKQMAFKILMNSLYGILGNQHFRFYNNNLASSITLSGQELLKFSAVHCDHYMETGKYEIDKNFLNRVEEPMDYVIYGDTDSIFVNLTAYLKRKNIEPVLGDEVDSAVSEIQDFLNKTLMGDMCRIHNLPADISMLQLKNEFLFSKYYTLNVKKKYATKVISQEGRRLNFIDIKGLEINRSDFSEITKEILEYVLNKILDDEFSLVHIMDYIEKSKVRVAEMASEGLFKIAKTVAFSKPLKEYKTITQNIKGMMMWNDLVNDDFHHGDRGYLFPILGIDLDKAPQSVKDNYNSKFLANYSANDLKAIVIPESEEKLPDYFIPNIKQIVSFSVTDRTDLLLEPLIKKTQDLLSW
jgi:DNA polymerase elongation subunit (family B)